MIRFFVRFSKGGDTFQGGPPFFVRFSKGCPSEKNFGQRENRPESVMKYQEIANGWRKNSQPAGLSPAKAKRSERLCGVVAAD